MTAGDVDEDFDVDITDFNAQASDFDPRGADVPHPTPLRTLEYVHWA